MDIDETRLEESHIVVRNRWTQRALQAGLPAIPPESGATGCGFRGGRLQIGG